MIFHLFFVWLVEAHLGRSQFEGRVSRRPTSFRLAPPLPWQASGNTFFVQAIFVTLQNEKSNKRRRRCTQWSVRRYQHARDSRNQSYDTDEDTLTFSGYGKIIGAHCKAIFTTWTLFRIYRMTFSSRPHTCADGGLIQDEDGSHLVFHVWLPQCFLSIHQEKSSAGRCVCWCGWHVWTAQMRHYPPVRAEEVSCISWEAF